MLEFPKKADFYTKAVTHNDYGEPIATGSLSFTTGVRITTLSFKESLRSTGTVDTSKFYVFTRKNPNTTSVDTGDFMKVAGQTYEVVGIDPVHGKRANITFLVDLVENPVV